MTRLQLRRFVPCLILLLLALGGCDLFAHKTAGSLSMFRESRNDAHIFFYAVYDNPGDKPTFDDVFRVHADEGYVGDMSDTQYVDTRVQPGTHIFKVSRIDWAGEVVSEATVKLDVAPSSAIFLVDHVLAKPVMIKKDPLMIKKEPQGTLLINSDSGEAMKVIGARSRVCPCD